MYGKCVNKAYRKDNKKKKHFCLHRGTSTTHFIINVYTHWYVKHYIRRNSTVIVNNTYTIIFKTIIY